MNFIFPINIQEIQLLWNKNYALYTTLRQPIGLYFAAAVNAIPVCFGRSAAYALSEWLTQLRRGGFYSGLQLLEMEANIEKRLNKAFKFTFYLVFKVDFKWIWSPVCIESLEIRFFFDMNNFCLQLFLCCAMKQFFNFIFFTLLYGNNPW